eukprot:gene6178-7156_t
MTLEILKRFKSLRFVQWLPYLYGNAIKKASLAHLAKIFPVDLYWTFVFGYKDKSAK